MYYYNKIKEKTNIFSFFKWNFIGGILGGIVGIVIGLFLISLKFATTLRINHYYLLFILPFGGGFVSFLYNKYGKNSSKGNNLVIEKINYSYENIPLRMVPLVFIGTVITHLFGGSAGREGTGVQIGASISENIGKIFKLNKYENRIILMAGVSSGFSAIFGTPLAGTIFGLEISILGKMSYEALIPCFTASIVGNQIVHYMGIEHGHYNILNSPNFSINTMLKIVIASILFGLTSKLFSELTHKLKYVFSKFFKNIVLKSFIGGIVVILLTYLIGSSQFLGLSLPLISDAFNGNIQPLDFLYKLIFTSVTLGSGYQGGEVTPLFVIGSTLGSTLSSVLSLSPSFLAALGLIGVFTGATNTPIASFVMGIEMFGSTGAIYMFMTCIISYIFSGHSGIYSSQNIGVSKNNYIQFKNNVSLSNYKKYNNDISS